MFTSSDDLLQSAVALTEGEKNIIANMANISSLIFHSMPNLNWVGFYLWDPQGQELVLGPFQGKPACIRIKAHRGVCGRAYSTKEIQRVPDVNSFADHIACDSETKSELVLPLIKNDICFGVLDLDSPQLDRFSEQDARYLSKLVEIIVPRLTHSLD